MREERAHWVCPFLGRQPPPPSPHPAVRIARTRVAVSAAAPRAALLAGPSGAGKTTLFHVLTAGDGGGPPPPHGTVPSMAENVGAARVAGRAVPLVDAPGHPRLRALAASRAPSAKAVVFVVDASDFLPHKADAADALAALLAPAARRRLPVLLLANKADKGAAAHSADFVRRRLEREVEAALASAGGALDAAGGGGGGGAGAGVAALARAGRPFTFAGLAAAGGPVVEAAAGAAAVGDVAAVADFLRRSG